MMRPLAWVCSLVLLSAASASAGTATLSWDPYTEGVGFKEFRVYRGAGSICGSSSIILPSLAGGIIPKGAPTPTHYVDATAPDTPGMLCYEVTAVGLYNGSAIESKRSNRAIKFVESPIPPPSLLDVQ